MTSRDRLLTAAHGGTPDRIPLAPYLGNHGARVADAQYRAWQLYGQDAVVAQFDNYYIAEGFGVEVDHHEDSTPTLKTTVVHIPKDPALWKLQRFEEFIEGRKKLVREKFASLLVAPQPPTVSTP